MTTPTAIRHGVTVWFNVATGRPTTPPADAIFLSPAGKFGVIFEGEIYQDLADNAADAGAILAGKQARRHVRCNPVAFTHEGTEYRAFPDAGAFFGIKQGELVYVAMGPDGRPDRWEDGEINWGPVTNMEEDGDGEILRAINLAFGTSYRAADFPGA